MSTTLALLNGNLVTCLSKFTRPQDGVCPKNPALCPVGAVRAGSRRTFIEGRLAARMGDKTTNCLACGSVVCFIKTGSLRTLIENFPAARRKDYILCGTAVTSAVMTFIGDY